MAESTASFISVTALFADMQCASSRWSASRVFLIAGSGVGKRAGACGRNKVLLFYSTLRWLPRLFRGTNATIQVLIMTL